VFVGKGIVKAPSPAKKSVVEIKSEQGWETPPKRLHFDLAILPSTVVKLISVNRLLPQVIEIKQRRLIPPSPPLVTPLRKFCIDL
jgi:hypothetical protein